MHSQWWEQTLCIMRQSTVIVLMVMGAESGYRLHNAVDIVVVSFAHSSGVRGPVRGFRSPLLSCLGCLSIDRDSSFASAFEQSRARVECLRTPIQHLQWEGLQTYGDKRSWAMPKKIKIMVDMKDVQQGCPVLVSYFHLTLTILKYIWIAKCWSWRLWQWEWWKWWWRGSMIYVSILLFAL